MQRILFLIFVVMWAGCDALDETQFSSKDQDGSGQQNNNRDDSKEGSILNLSTMTLDEIVAFAATYDDGSTGCQENEDGKCRIPFMDVAQCASDGFLVAALGTCDEGSDGVFCSPDVSDCRTESVTKCRESRDGDFEFVAQWGTCVSEGEGPRCDLTGEMLVMNCADMLGTRYCDDKGILEVTDVTCDVTPIDVSEDMTNPIGCIPAATKIVTECGADEFCWTHWGNISADDENIDSDSSVSLDRTASFYYPEDATCEWNPCAGYAPDECTIDFD